MRLISLPICNIAFFFETVNEQRSEHVLSYSSYVPSLSLSMYEISFVLLFYLMSKRYLKLITEIIGMRPRFSNT